MSNRSKGARVQRLAIDYAQTFPNTIVLPLYQPSRFAKPQPFDLLVFRSGYLLRLVEVRSNSWRTHRDSTKQLAILPGEMCIKQIWMHRNGQTGFAVREWDEATEKWVPEDAPWQDV